MNDLVDLAAALRQYRPIGAAVAPASFAKDGATVWTLAKLAAGPIPAAEHRFLATLAAIQGV